MRAVVACVLGCVLGLADAARAGPIDPGFDLFQTPGDGSSFVDLSGLGLGSVPVEGVPFGPGGVDTVVERLGTSIGPAASGGTIDIELVALQLVSISPVDLTPLGGPFVGVFSDLFVTLDAGAAFGIPVPDAPLLPSIGRMEILHPAEPGGTFTSCFGDAVDCVLGVPGGGIFADAIFTVVGGDPSNVLDVFFSALAPKVVLESTGTWSHIPPPNDPHPAMGLTAGGFYIETIEHTGPHQPIVALEPSIVAPEPSALALLVLGGVLLGGRRAWRAKAGLEPRALHRLAPRPRARGDRGEAEAR